MISGRLSHKNPPRDTLGARISHDWASRSAPLIPIPRLLMTHEGRILQNRMS
jgi:hypothetical protein